MGIASSLFYSSFSEKITLHSRIVPSSEQRKEQQECWNELAEFLIEWLKNKTGLNVKTWLQGSYKMGTQIRPRNGETFDIDLGIYLEWEGGPDSHMKAAELKKLLQKGLLVFKESASNVKEVLVPPKERCGCIVYGENFHIDLPGYHLDPVSDSRYLATESNNWENSDPKALVKWFLKEAGDEDDRSQIRRIVRYLKIWTALKFDKDSRPSSIFLTVLVTEEYKKLPRDSSNADDEVLYEVVCRILKRFDSSREVRNPVQAAENLNRLSSSSCESFIEKLTQFREIARAALSASTVLEAADEWSKLFEQFFPIPETIEESGSSSIMQPDIVVIARPDGSKGQIGQTYSERNRIGPVPKNYSLEFKVVSQVPLNAEVQWVVRNMGVEAEEANDMGHLGKTGITTNENTAYNGIHSMDCTIKKSGTIIGFRRIPVSIIGAMSRGRSKRTPVRYKHQ